MDLSVLQVFVEVMRQGSFASVARDRNLDPSSISRSIAGLEQELGVRLFQHTTRRLSPTEAGRAYFARIEPLVNELRAAVEVAADTAGQPQGTLRTTASVAFGQHCILPLLPQFQALYPNLTVDLLLTDAVVDLLAERIDVAIRLGHLADSTLVAQRLMVTRYSVCASPGYLKRLGPPARPEDITHHNCLLFPLSGFRSSWRFRDAQGHETAVPVQGRTIISSGLALQHCAIAGMGLALLPHWLVGQDLQTGALVRVLPNYEVAGTDFGTAAWLVYPSRRYMPSKVRVWMDFLQGQAQLSDAFVDR